jgi:DNA-binding PadR family transcriptional regulator
VATVFAARTPANTRYFDGLPELPLGELKRLVQLGYADAEEVRFGRRRRTQYSITPAGRVAMRDWLRTPPQPPALEFEGLLGVMYADQGSVADLLEALRVTREQAEAVMGAGRTTRP